MIRLSPALVQPIASDDVAAALADVALGAPVNGMIEIAGPERVAARRSSSEVPEREPGTHAQVIADVHARYFGSELNDQSLTPGDNPRIGSTRFDDWLSRSIPQKVSSEAGATTRCINEGEHKCSLDFSAELPSRLSPSAQLRPMTPTY